MNNENLFNKTSKDDEFYIHFDSKEICDNFLKKYRGRIGNRCCFGKGVQLCEVTSFSEIYSIKNKFILDN